MDMNKLMKEAAKMQAKLVEAQESLAEEELEGTSGGGVVKVTVTGDGRFTAIKIDPSAVDPEDMSLLEDLILAAINEAQRAQQELQQQRLAPLTGGMGIPGLT